MAAGVGRAPRRVGERVVKSADVGLPVGEDAKRCERGRVKERSRAERCEACQSLFC